MDKDEVDQIAKVLGCCPGEPRGVCYRRKALSLASLVCRGFAVILAVVTSLHTVLDIVEAMEHHHLLPEPKPRRQIKGDK